METSIKTKSKYRIQYASFIYFEIIYILFIKLFIDILGIPNFVWYLCDAINILLVLNGVTQLKMFRKIKANQFLLLLIVLFAFSMIGFTLNYGMGSILLYLWGFRNLARMFGFWIVCIIYLQREHLVKIFHILYVAFIINFFLSLVQYSMGIKGDNLGGIFGIKGASNAYTLTLMTIVIALAIGCYLRKEISLSKIIAISVMALIIAPLAELKAFFIIFPSIIIIALIFDGRMTLRMFVTIVGALLGLYFAFKILSIVYPNSMNALTLEGMKEYLTDENGIGYSSVDDLSRTGAIGKIHDMFFKNDILKNIFGFGLGNCETSNYSFLNSSFYRHYEYLHYRWFFDAMLYLEMGAGGLFLYALFILMILIYIIRYRKLYNDNNKSMLILSVIITIYVFFVAFYNSSLRIEAGYLTWFALSVPFILKKQSSDENPATITNVFKITNYKIKIKG